MKTIKKQEDIVESIKDILLKDSLTLAIAESVTCGHLQAAFAAIKDTGKFFQGGITVYNLGQKARHLKVEPIGAERENCVCREVAETMALNVTEMFSSTVGVSITGYASLIPEMGIKDLFAFCAVSVKGKIVITEKLTTEKENIIEVQNDYCEQVLNKLLHALKKRSYK